MLRLAISRKRVAPLRLAVTTLGVLAACSRDASSITGQTSQISHEPAGYTLIAETDMSGVPSNLGLPITSGVPSTLGLIAGYWLSEVNPGSLQSIVGGSSLPVSFPIGSGSALQHILEAGTPPGYGEAGSHYADFWLWDFLGAGAYGTYTGNEYSAFYQSTWFSVYGNGTTIETPSDPGIKVLGYWGVTNNGASDGPTQIYTVFSPVSTIRTTPLTTSEQHIDMYTQNGSNIALYQNLNLSKHVVIGQVHHFEQVLTLGTAGGANGTWDWWLDGVHIGSYSNVPFIDAAYASGSGGTGVAGFWAWDFEPVWGGSGGANKTRNDAIYIGHTYISGIFLRNHQ